MSTSSAYSYGHCCAASQLQLLQLLSLLLPVLTNKLCNCCTTAVTAIYTDAALLCMVTILALAGVAPQFQALGNALVITFASVAALSFVLVPKLWAAHQGQTIDIGAIVDQANNKLNSGKYTAAATRSPVHSPRGGDTYRVTSHSPRGAATTVCDVCRKLIVEAPATGYTLSNEPISIVNRKSTKGGMSPTGYALSKVVPYERAAPTASNDLRAGYGEETSCGVVSTYEDADIDGTSDTL
jgi:hypothetical protein